MPDVTINSGQTGKLERTFANEGELLNFIVAWCVAQDREIEGDVTIGDQDVFTFRAGATYHLKAGPSGDDDGEGWVSLVWVSG